MTGKHLPGTPLPGVPVKLSISSEKPLVYIGEREISLLPKQYRVLVCLARNRGRIVPYLQLLHECWGEEYEREDIRVLQISMSRLRALLGDVGGRGKISHVIRTYWDTGYELIAEVEGWPCISENDMTIHIHYKGQHFTGNLKRID
jgi:DNA-binding winged helix-turn-helix (wHTH) protein